jgi:hypothetical protein
VLDDAKANFQPLPAIPAARDPATVARSDLGRHLFFENRVSADGHRHQPDKQAADGLAKAIGVFGKENARNAPSIFNASLNFKQHWRGDRESFEDQAEKSLLGAASFGNPYFSGPIGRLKAIPAYGPAFAAAFPDDKDPINSKNFGLAIAAYERTLLTQSKFDAYLDGPSADRRRTGGIAQIYRSRLCRLPRWRRDRRQFVPEVWRRRRLLESDGRERARQRPRGRDEKATPIFTSLRFRACATPRPPAMSRRLLK